MQVLPTAPSPTVTHLINLDALIDDYFFSSKLTSSVLPSFQLQYSTVQTLFQNSDSGFRLQKILKFSTSLVQGDRDREEEEDEGGPKMCQDTSEVWGPEVSQLLRMTATQIL